MTDRDLLERAAKAAGYEFGVIGDVTRIKVGDPLSGWNWDQWNPLADDGDALRLAVKLGMLIDDIERGYMAGHILATAGPSMAAYEPRDPDPYAATRRAIVRAAAAMI